VCKVEIDNKAGNSKALKSKNPVSRLYHSTKAKGDANKALKALDKSPESENANQLKAAAKNSKVVSGVTQKTAIPGRSQQTKIATGEKAKAEIDQNLKDSKAKNTLLKSKGPKTSPVTQHSTKGGWSRAFGNGKSGRVGAFTKLLG